MSGHYLPSESSKHAGTETGHHVLGAFLPPVLQVSDNMLHYLFTNYEMANTVFDGLILQKPDEDSAHYLRDLFPSASPITIHIDLNVDGGGLWTLAINKDSDPPFYTGTSPDGPTGDYNGTGNPVDPVTIIEPTTQSAPTFLTGVSVLSYWLVKTDATWLAWARASSTVFGQLPDKYGFNDGAGDVPYSSGYQFGISNSVVSFGLFIQHIALVVGGPSIWRLLLFQQFILFPTFEVYYTRNDGDGPVPYGTYSLDHVIGLGSLPTPPPATLTISAASDNAPM